MAVHTKLSEANIKNIIKIYRLDDLVDFQGIKEGIENTNYLLTTKKKKFVITIFEKRVDISSIPFYFEVMINSNAYGIECPIPIKDKHGEYINIIKNKKMAVFIFLKGSSKKNWSEEDCFKVGAKLANFHAANKNNIHKAKNQFGLHYWKKVFMKFKNKLDKIIPKSSGIIEQEINFISHNWPRNLPKGIIHADLFPDNVFFEKNRISGFLDFYFSCNDYFSYDLAITSNAWCFINNKFNKNYFFSLVSGYESVRSLQSIEKKNFNILLRGAALRFFFTRAYDSINSIESKFLKKKDPKEFFNILKFHIDKNSESFYLNE